MDTRQTKLDGHCVSRPDDYGFVGIWEDDVHATAMTTTTPGTAEPARPQLQQRDVRSMLVATTIDQELASADQIARVARPFMHPHPQLQQLQQQPIVVDD